MWKPAPLFDIIFKTVVYIGMWSRLPDYDMYLFLYISRLDTVFFLYMGMWNVEPAFSLQLVNHVPMLLHDNAPAHRSHVGQAAVKPLLGVDTGADRSILFYCNKKSH